MLNQKLHTTWKLTDFAPGEGDPMKLSIPGLETSAWLDIAVPGDVNRALLDAGRMPDPHFGDNARRCYWVTSREWWYRLEFVPEKTDCSFADLVLDGLDGHVDIYLNGQKLGRAENAFRPHRFEVKDRLLPDQPNVLLLRFQSIDEILGGPRRHELTGWGNWRALMRKPQFSFGWDWSLPLPSIGIAGTVQLEYHNGCRIVDVSVQPFISGRLDFKFQMSRGARDVGYELVLRVKGHGADIEQRLVRRSVFSHTSVFIDDPRLWWPNGMGDQPLYDWEVELVVDGQAVDRRSGRVGIRECRILEEPFTEDAGPGISFWIEVNGQRVFCKGGNWIPLELWPATATDEQYRFYLEKTAEANFNMQRIWGGGIYERDIFYDLCDELGIMVWQDFMFASSGYPVDLLRHEIIAEAEYQIKRLRNHPSIILWCGCNEDCFSWGLPAEANADALSDEIIPDDVSQQLRINRLKDDPQIYSMILRGLVSKWGLGVPYTESSPQSYEDAGNFPQSGNCHISAWKYALFETDGHPELFRRHFEKVCSFDSEFCIQGPCCVRTLKAFLPEDHHWPPDDIWTYHIQRGHANLPHHEQHLTVAGAVFGEMNDLQTYVKHGQAMHLEMMRAEFESARRDRPNNGGTMMWMYNDCWPTSNWSIIDYYRRPKPSYYAAKRACATLLPIVMERSGRIEFFFSNDGGKPCGVKVLYGQEKLDGSIVWATEDSFELEACDTLKFQTLDRGSLKIERGDYLFIDAEVDGIALERIVYFPDGWKEIDWPWPHIKITIPDKLKQNGRHVTILKLETDAFARLCHVVLPDGAWADDNFFDICAGHQREIIVHSGGPLDLSQVRIGHWHTEWP